MGDILTYEHFMNLERIPTASILIRVEYASIAEDGKYISINNPDPNIQRLAYEDALPYADGEYSTAYFLTTEIERKMFDLRRLEIK